MTNPAVPGEKLLARNTLLRRLSVALVLAVGVAVAIWAVVWGDRWSSHVDNGTHTNGPVTPAPRL